MRHRKKQTTLGRKKSVREALLRSQAESLILHGKIKTTLAKAKALRGVVEPLVTKAKRGSLTDRRNIMKVLYTEKAVKKIMDKIGPKYREREGGYTRITKAGTRATDSAAIAYIEFV
jgi:large subunit ribosomal protein L17